ncbi:hypothetical protein [Rhizobium rhizogenes]|uniref:hypothetical protein n=1 Tax=Rhizobium rhizogenes TaxID=359 RepID=UPI0004D3E904|nr:hypothetical protein [Rhizobium rhizogenes]KEA07459.1 hypothetical protein CN09_11110 [Rhizobium rhizogenes]NTJ22275.1 hypothetical protein [Rhizobium rhizogenes]QUE80993.1 hypothetical protein EML492_04055 [Rhizobium rhizogenes]TQO80903.1 hypothetical protein FFE80_07345 [Rhizobium rhizogenes]TRB51497.1 hypothetical protein EXN69_26230 [Rhizobium rhizogenes]
MTVLETAAKAMYARNVAAASGRPPWDKATDLVKAHFVELARAAFESVREPSDDMIEVGFGTSPRQGWQNMIDAALKEDKTQ